MSDVTAVVLTMGEDITQRAIESLAKQTLLPEEIIVINNVSPFHKALNQGAAQVKTEFFVQVDSDMILDPKCLSTLRSLITDNIGITVGALRDPLIGRTIGIKLFRTACFKGITFTDTISPDTDFMAQIASKGWKTIYAHDFVPQDESISYTLGEHKPNYTPLYTFRKYILEGRRYRYREVPKAFKAMLERLECSSHEMALIAQIAMAQGLFLPEEKDLLKPLSNNPEFDLLEKFLVSGGVYLFNVEQFLSKIKTTPTQAFKQGYKLGIELQKQGAFPTFKQFIHQLNDCNHQLKWFNKIGLYRGLFVKNFTSSQFQQDSHLLISFVYNNSHASIVDRLILQKIRLFLSKLG